MPRLVSGEVIHDRNQWFAAERNPEQHEDKKSQDSGLRHVPCVAGFTLAEPVVAPSEFEVIFSSISQYIIVN